MGGKIGPNIITEGLVFAIDAANPKCYNFNNGTCVDLIGGRVGNIAGDTNRNSNFNGGWEFDNVDDFISFNDSDFANPESTSFTCNIFVEQDNVGFSQNVYVSKGNVGSANQGWSMTYNNVLSGNTVHVRCNGNNTSSQRASQSLAHQINKISMITMVINRDTESITGYIDGENDGWYDGGNGPTDNLITGFAPITSTSNFKIGTRADGAVDFGGKMFSVQIYNRALSHEEIKRNYNAIKSRF